MELVCITCPNGCKLNVEYQNGEIIVTGNKCKKGEAFAKEEMLAPKRSVTTTVKTIFPSLPVVPVRTEGEIPKEKIFDFIALCKDIVVGKAYDSGEVILEKILNTDVNLICTVNMKRFLGGENNG